MIAWEEQNKETELELYDCIGLSYYYINDMEKASYYHQKAIKGKLETNESVIKKVSLKELKIKRDNFKN